MNSLWHRCNSWLRSIAKRERLHAEMDEEVRFHLEARAADLRRSGLNEQQARRRARMEFGGVATHKDEMRRSLGLGWWDELGGDLRYAARILRKSPGFTLIAVSSLALAIGANTTIFSVANEMLYERLGVPHAEQLRLLTLTGDRDVVIHMSWGDNWRLPDGQERYDMFAYPVYQQLRAQNRVMEDIFAFKDLDRLNLTVDGRALSASMQAVSGNFYQQMQVKAALGRTLLPSDDGAPGTGAVAVISDGFWSREFGRSQQAVGKTIRIDMTQVTIVGVNPRGFTGAARVQGSPDIFVPMSMMPLLRAPIGNSGAILSSTELWWVQLMARVKPGVADEQARVALDLVVNAAVHGTMHVEAKDTMPHIRIEDGGKGLNFSALQYADSLHVLLAMVGGVLLMACANMANLMLARASARRREMSVRLALGAGRWRILRQVLTESLVLSFAGGALGLLMGYFGRTTLPKLLANAWEGGDMNVPFNWKVFAFTAAITIGTGILFGIFPAWVATKAEIGAALKQGAQSATRRRKAWSGKAIVAFQVGLSTLLVIGAGLFLRTLIKLNSIDPGFKADHLVLFAISLPSNKYPPPKDGRLHGRIEEALRALPGVQGVSASNMPFLGGGSMNGDFYLEDAPDSKFSPEDEGRHPKIEWTGVDFLSVMKIPMIAGRNFNQQDTETSTKVSIVSQSLARKFFPNQNPIGRRFAIGTRRKLDGPADKDTPWLQIIGVCADVRYTSLREPPPTMHYDLYSQQNRAESLTYVVRTPLKPTEIVPSLRAAVQRIDPSLPLMDVRTEEEQVDASLQQERMFATLSSGFGVLALLLACVGIYGIMAYTVAQRTNEIGIRLALGAERGRVQRMVLREAGCLSVIGVVSGLAVALAMGRLVGSMLYGLTPGDPVSLAGAGCLLLGVALVAGWVPAMRASRVEPMEALRHE